MSTTTKQTIVRRKAEPVTTWSSAIHPVLQRVYANRGVKDDKTITHKLQHLLSPLRLGGMKRAVGLLVEAIQTGASIMVSGDYDCDGATGTSVAVKGLRMLGAKDVRFIIPDRFKQGYGLSPALVEAMVPAPDVIVTVDSGVSSLEGVAAAKAKGITVIVTDHHLPGDSLPGADAIVNPNLDGDPFPSKKLAGVGVMFYVLLALRARLRALGTWVSDEPPIGSLLDLVALGTVADLVVLDQNNRILVETGLKRIRAGLCCPGLQALIEVADKEASHLTASDFAFGIAPKLNAAGRLENMSLGVETLITESLDEARLYAKALNDINKERRELQASMTEAAEVIVANAEDTDAIGITVYDPSWHAGVVGLVASKLKEELHRPVFAFAKAGEDSDEVRGSGRSIEGFHLRDALVEVDSRHPGLLLKYGGHAMAAGLSLREKDLPLFKALFDQVASQKLKEEDLQAVVYSDGELAVSELSFDTAVAIRMGGPWGQGFPSPVFDNLFQCDAYRVLGGKHLKLELIDPRSGQSFNAIAFFAYTGTPPPESLRVAYELDINRWKGRESLQLIVRHLEAA